MKGMDWVLRYMMISIGIGDPLIPLQQVGVVKPGAKTSGRLNVSYNIMDLPPGTPTSGLAVLENLSII